MNILITGGAGYIGSHTILELLKTADTVICVDNGCNTYQDDKEKLPESLKRVQAITGEEVVFYYVDICDKKALDEVFKKHKVDSVVHFAALKAVGESCHQPLQYYKNNITGTTVLLEVMAEHGVFELVFSSSSTVYGEPQFLPLTEEHPTGKCTNPYGRSKFFVEEILKDLCASDKRWKVISLRYFNPIGSHESGLIGEDPKGEPKNLMPYIAQVAVGKLKMLKILGNDYPTHDGTGVRDYIHIADVADGHLAALNKLKSGSFYGFVAYNLATGCGYSVLDLVKKFVEVSGREIPCEFAPRRPGDIVGTSYASAEKAEKELGWKPKRGLKEMCEDAWRWQKKNPNGFSTLDLDP